MDTTRLKSVIDLKTLGKKRVALIGAGASATLACDLVRSGLRLLTLVDPDIVGKENISRQGHDPASVGTAKVDALKERLLEINPHVDIITYPFDASALPDDEAVELFADTDLFVAATDSFEAQAWTNRMALMRNVPAVFIGLYSQGLGGEVVWTDPARLPCCFRCLCSNRYAVQKQAISKGISLDPSSDGADVMSVRIPDAVAGQIIIGLLTRGADNKYGRLMDALGDRQYLQLSLSPEFSVNGRDLVRERLHIPKVSDTYFTWSSVAMRDPDNGQLPCVDCETLRGHKFVQKSGKWHRVAESPTILEIEECPRIVHAAADTAAARPEGPTDSVAI